LTDSSSLQECLDATYRYLSYRPRSEAELRRLLRRRGFDSELIAETVARLREQNLSDDLSFARFWKESRLGSRPRSRRLIAKELRDKDVAEDIIREVTRDIDDESHAYQLGASRMRVLAGLDYRRFKRRLSSYLAYRGFSREVVVGTVSRLWQERE